MMRNAQRGWALMAAMFLTVFATEVTAQASAKVRKDLTSVIALQGKPCGQVTDAKRQAANDYLVTCSDGNRYRVYVDPSNRVTITKR